MQFYSYNKEYPNYNDESRILEILEKNQIQLNTDARKIFSLIKNQDFWFILCNENDDIIAECSVDQYKDFYEIHDVFVMPKFRGNHYSIMLIMNVMYYFASIKKFKVFKVYTSNTNISACKIYTRLFGNPISKDDEWIYWLSE